ncbi:MAG: glycoside hydrolase family 97 catalytic domain-containing protein [Rikenellaceae bacterium]
MRFLLTLLGLFACAVVSAETQKTQVLKSPDGEYEFTFYQRPAANGHTQMSYTLDFKGERIVEQSDLGVVIENQLNESALAVPNEDIEFWCENFTLVDVQRSQRDSVWHPLYGERAEVRDRYNAMTLIFEKGDVDKTTLDQGQLGSAHNKRKQYMMDIEVRAYDSGVAFRYHFPEATNGLFLHITGEQTSFSMPSGTLAYFERWAQGPYSLRELKDWGAEESERPLTMKLPSGTYVTLAEAQMVDYVRGKFALSQSQPSTLVLSMYDCADVITPYDSPWRVVMAASSPIELVNNNDIILNLNDECVIADASWIAPGKVFRSGLSQGEVTTAIDFAAECGYQYVHLDAGWYGREMWVSSDASTVDEAKDLDLKKLCDYAASKGLGIFVYVNQRALITQLDDILPLYKEWGIKGIKFGFVQVGNQRWSTWLHEAVAKCAEYEIMVDIHDEYRPTGFSRTYPNLMTQEGILGNEVMPDATHNTILPYTRMVAGAGDYTFAYYSSKIKNTKAHQLALPVIYYSPLQFMHWYDTPKHYVNKPAEMAFWHAVPTIWDDSKALDGEIGEYIVQARRSGDEWFVGAITNVESRKVVVDTRDFLTGGKYRVLIYEDDLKSGVKISEKRVSAGDKLTFKLVESGGVALRFIPN